MAVPSVSAGVLSSPLPVVWVATPPSIPTVPLPAPRPSRGTVAYPAGGRWPTGWIALAVQLVATAKLTIRSVPRVLAAVFAALTGRTWEASLSWTTVRSWLMRLGLYALWRPLPRADDWAYLIDHTIQIGTVKCFAVVGLRLSECPPRCLQHGDLELIALVPMEHSTAATLKRVLEQAEQRTGPPRLIVSDQGRDLRAGIECYRQKHPRTVATCDAAHQGANHLKRLLGADPRWSAFVAQLGQTRGRLRQTPLACCLGPQLRPKARFMNLAAPLRWARWCLRLLDRAVAQDQPLSARQQAVLEGLDTEKLEAQLGWLREYRAAVEEWSQWHEVIQVMVRQVRRHGIDRDTVAELGRQFETMELMASSRDTAAKLLEFLAEQAWVGRLGGERLIGSTEILESLFGAYKDLQGQQSQSGLTGLMLVLGALVSHWTPETIQEALEATPSKAVQAWTMKHLGLTVQAQRRILQTIFPEP